MSVFLEYIVEKGHISKEQLLKAVASQMESMPSLVRLLLEEGRCSADEIYGLLIEGAKKNNSLYEMIKLNNILTDAELHDFLNKQNMQSMSLGDLLIADKAVTREQYDQILRDYASSKGAEASRSSAPTTNEKSPDLSAPAEPSPAPAAPAGISAAALESLMAVQGLDQDMIAELEGSVATPDSDQVEEQTEESVEESSETESAQEVAEESSKVEPINISDASPTLGEYLDFYSEPLQSELFVTANRYRLKGKARDLEFIHENILKILSLAKLNGFDFQVKLLEPYENYIGDLLNQGSDAPEEWRACPSEMLELLWEFRKTITEGKSEGQLLANKENKEKYINNLKTVMSYIKRSA